MKSLDLPQILPQQDAAALRSSYLVKFIETQSEHYKSKIATVRQCSDGEHYDGYLWECLRKPVVIDYQRLDFELSRFAEVMVMADNHSRDKVINGPLWPYPPYSVVRFKTEVFKNALPVLPEDMYIFDSSVAWTLILTHEHEDQRRICCSMSLPNEGGV